MIQRRYLAKVRILLKFHLKVNYYTGSTMSCDHVRVTDDIRIRIWYYITNKFLKITNSPDSGELEAHVH